MNSDDEAVKGADSSQARDASRGAPTPERRSHAGQVYLLVSLIVAVCVIGAIALVNRSYAPEMYDDARLGHIAEAFSNGQNYAVFDLNINIRKLREEQIARMSLTPSIVILGASQWQEATTRPLANRHALNAHIHRDYYEDVLGMVELFTRHDKLPRDLVITVRDRLFTPVAERTDYLWLPGIPYYQAMARRLSLEPLGFWESQPLQRPRELISLAMLFDNAARWHNADVRPHPTTMNRLSSLDVLLPDGSIRWSDEHLAAFTPERSRKVSLAHAEASRNRPPQIDPKGVEALDTLLAFLAVRGVRVHLAHPPFNPLFWEHVQGTPYMEGLRQVEAVTRELAAKHKLGLVGSFDPADLGCTAAMFIDAEHANASCLSRLMADIADSIDLPAVAPAGKALASVSRRELRSQRLMIASGWLATERVPQPTLASAAGGVRALTVGAEVPVEPATRQDGSPSALRTERTETAAAGTSVGACETRPHATAAPVRRRARAAAPARPRPGPARRKAVAFRLPAAKTAFGLVWPGDHPSFHR